MGRFLVLVVACIWRALLAHRVAHKPSHGLKALSAVSTAQIEQNSARLIQHGGTARRTTPAGPPIRGRAALRRLGRRLRPSCPFADLVLDFLPIRSYFVAKLNHSCLLLWELTISPGGVLDVGHAERVRSVQSVESGSYYDSSAVGFLPLSNDVLVHVTRGAQREAVVIDSGTGVAKLRIPEIHVTAVSPLGSAMSGCSLDGVGRLSISLWKLGAGGAAAERIRHAMVGPPRQDDIPLLSWHSVFSPSGDEVVFNVVRSQHAAAAGEAMTQLWSTSADGPTCGASFSNAFWILKLAYDGHKIVACRGSHQTAMILEVRRGARSCDLVDISEHGLSCDDVFLRGGLFLQRRAHVVTVTDSSARVVHEAKVSALFPVVFVLGGSAVLVNPSPRPALKVKVCLWDLAGGGGLRQVGEVARWMPAISEDGKVLAAILPESSGPTVLVIDLAGGPPLRIPLDGGQAVGSVAVSAALPADVGHT